jgi:hypothetical protein
MILKKFENFQIDEDIQYELFHLDKYNDEELLDTPNDKFGNTIKYNPYDLNDMYKLLKKYQKIDNTVFLKKTTTENLYPKDLDILMKGKKYNII